MNTSASDAVNAAPLPVDRALPARAGMRRWLSLLTISCLMVLSGVIFNVYVLSSPEGLEHHLVNSDALLPMQMAWDLHHNPLAWHTYQWPRVPSLFPDMLWFWGAEWAGLGWRHALMGYETLMLSLLALTLGIVAKTLRPRRDGAYLDSILGAAGIVALLVALSAACAALGFLGAWKDMLNVISPVTHGDGFLLSMLAAPMAMAAWRGDAMARLATLALCVVGTFCDLLFVPAFLLPFLLTTRLPVVRRILAEEKSARFTSLLRPSHLRALCAQDAALPLATALACVAGGLAQTLLFRQPVSSVQVPTPLYAIHWFGHDLIATPWALAFVGGAYWMMRQVKPAIETCLLARDDSTEESTRDMLLIHGALAAAISFILLLAVYLDRGTYRYALPTMWWPVALALASLPRQRATVVALQAAAALAVVFVGGAPALLAWRSPTEACLSAHASEQGLRAGLATYWVARRTEASSDWRWQIAQITEFGAQRIWGNDVALYTRDSHDADQPARFNFIMVGDEAIPERLREVYGAPTRSFDCPDAQIWVYDRWLTPQVRAADGSN